MSIWETFAGLATPQIADACLRLEIPFRVAPPGLAPVRQGDFTAGPVLPVRHYGSVDIFLEAYEGAAGGEVLVIDNGNRADEGCIGDLTVIEALFAGLAGLVVWGRHRDTTELLRLELPVFTYGACLAGPTRLDDAEPDALVSAHFGDFAVSEEDAVFADGDGALFVPLPEAAGIMAAAAEIRRTEEAQTELVRGGQNLRSQLRFDEYLAKRQADPTYTFRQHLREVGGAIEE